MRKMRAKMYVDSVISSPTQESVHFACVSDASYSGDGASENNTFARYTPFGEAGFSITNPELIGQYKQGDTFYVDFTPAEQA